MIGDLTFYGSYCQRTHARSLYALRLESSKLCTDQSTRFAEIQTALQSLEDGLVLLRSHKRDDNFESQISSLESAMSTLTISQKSILCGHAILKSLRFESRELRHRTIQEAHQETFQWAFQQGKGSGDSAMALGSWLESGEGIFWVSGKPGSGKSTLMKFIADHAETGHKVARWSRHKDCVIASHYFWSSGTSMQKTQQGLLQTLLFDILRQCPELIGTACAEKLSQFQKSIEDQTAWKLSQFHKFHKLVTYQQLNWTERELHDVLRSLAESATATTKTFCFFIDGLDEYSGDHYTLCRILQQLASSPRIKLCVSSRPWNVFEQHFASCPKLCMQDLTRGDILLYAKDQLEEHPQWDSIIEKNPGAAHELLEEIADRACGVFLWVVLVITQLRSDLTNRDRESDLRRRLEDFPTELEDFFRHILESIEPFYHSKMSTILQMAIIAKEPLPAIMYEFHDQEYDDDDYVFSMAVQPFTKRQREELWAEMKCRLNSRTRGLLEVDRVSDKVVFLHRTVRDFLTTPETWDLLKLKERKVPCPFDLNLSILKACVAYIKRMDFLQPFARHQAGLFKDLETVGRHRQDSIVAAVRAAGDYAAEVCAASGPGGTAAAAAARARARALELLDAARGSMGALHAQRRLAELPGGLAPAGLFMEIVLRSAAPVEYVRAALAGGPGPGPGGPGLLSHLALEDALRLPSSIDAERGMPWSRRAVEVLRCVLEARGDACGPRSPSSGPAAPTWDALMAYLSQRAWGLDGEKARFLQSLVRRDLISLMLEKGADPNVLVDGRQSAGVGWGLRARNRASRDGIPAWVAFVLLSLDLPADRSLERKYMKTLGKFLARADLTFPGHDGSVVFIIANQPASSSAEYVRATFWNFPLISKVVDALLSELQRRQLEWPWKAIRRALPRDFPEEICEHLVLQHPELFKRKRKRSSTGNGEIVGEHVEKKSKQED